MLHKYSFIFFPKFNFNSYKSCILLLILGLSISYCNAKGNSNVQHYYDWINKAELSVVDSNYQKALKEYQHAFQLKSANTEDLSNAFTVTYLLNDSILAKRYAKELELRGISVNQYWIPMDSANNPGLYKYVTQDIGSVSFSSIVKAKPYRLFSTLFKTDQAVRKDNVTADSMRGVDAHVLSKVIKYIKDYGYPTCDTNSEYCTLDVIRHWCFIILWHHRGDANAKELDSVLLHQVMLGNLSPHEWEALTMYTEGHQDKYASRLWLIDFSTLSADQIKQIDENRKKVYLESLEDYRKKFAFEKIMERTLGCPAYIHPFHLLNLFLVPSDNAIGGGLK